MKKKATGKLFKVGDHVRWNSEAGYVSGIIIKRHTKDVVYKGYTHHANPGEPQYEIKSDQTDHIAMHKSDALTKIKASPSKRGGRNRPLLRLPAS